MAMTARASNIRGTLIAEKRNGSRRFHVHDSLGSTIALVSDSSKETDTYTYWPYGEIRTFTGSTSSTPFKFCGAWGYYDDGNQLYVRARYLRSQLGRWLTRDSLWPDESPYGYALSNPVTVLDNLGKSPSCPEDCCEKFKNEELNKKECGYKGQIGKWAPCNLTSRQLGPLKKACSESISNLTQDQKDSVCKELVDRLRELAKGCSYYCGNLGNCIGEGSANVPQGMEPWAWTYCCEGKLCGQWCCSVGGKDVISLLPPCIAYCFAAHEKTHHTMCTQPGMRPKVPPGADPYCVGECVSWTTEASCLRLIATHQLKCTIPIEIIRDLGECDRIRRGL